jgi:hypothetical protein
MRQFSAVCAVAVSLIGSALAQPPMPPKAPRPAAPPITQQELERGAGGPTLITLHFKDVTIQDILGELSKQSGLRVRANFWSDEQRKKKYSLDMDKMPFWQAVKEIGDKLKLFPQQWGGQSGLVLSPDSDGSSGGSVQLNTPLLSIVAKTLTRTHTINYKAKSTADQPEPPNMSLQTAILIDPKLRLLNNAARATVTEIVDEKGKSLKGDQNDIYIYGETPSLWQMQVPLKYSTTMGKKLARLSGSFHAFVVARFETWDIPDVMKAKGATKIVKIGTKDETYTLEDITKNGDSIQVRISVKRALEIAPPPADTTAEGQQLKYARRDWSRWMRLEDAKGNQYQGYNSGGSEDEMNFTFNSNQQFPGDMKAEDPQKMQIDIPLDFRLLDVPFEFKDLLLP